MFNIAKYKQLVLANCDDKKNYQCGWNSGRVDTVVSWLFTRQSKKKTASLYHQFHLLYKSYHINNELCIKHLSKYSLLYMQNPCIETLLLFPLFGEEWMHNELPCLYWYFFSPLDGIASPWQYPSVHIGRGTCCKSVSPKNTTQCPLLGLEPGLLDQ